jgi:TolB-like protein
VSLRQSQLLGPYRLGALLGRGGMGEVYRATDTRLQRDVALKVLPREFAADPDRLARFEREARAAAGLNHPNILSVFDVGTDDGVPYFVCELLEGETLRDRLTRGPLPIHDAVDYAAQMARGLAAAHDTGIVHRDIKPENVFITTDGRLKILDFGVARFDAAPARPELQNAVTTPGTTPGVLVGTFPYMSPEQVRGEAVDPRSDIFSLGTVLYEMLSGRSAFAAATPAETLSAILTVDPIAGLPSARIPPTLIEITRHCLEKDTRRRFQSAHDVAFGLSVAPGASTVSAGAPTPHSPPRRRWALAAAVAAVALAVAVAAWMGRTPIPSRPAARPPGAKSIAALPFINLGAREADEYFTDGMTDSLITDLAKVNGLVVLARSAVFRYKNQDVDLQKVGQELGAEYVLHGSVQRDGTRVRVNAHLVDAASGLSVWTERMDEDVKDLFALQDRISSRIVAALQLTLNPSAVATASHPPTTNPQAYESYLQGLYYRHKGGETLIDQAIPFFDRATREDPTFALAHAALGSAYTQRFFYLDADRQWEQKAFLAIERALALDPNLAEAYLARGQLAWSLPNGFPHEQAVSDLQKAIALNPGLADAHRELGKIYMHIGLLDKSIDANTMALRLDPADRTAQARRAGSYWSRGDCERALEVAHQSDRRTRAGALACLGRDEEAMALVVSQPTVNDESLVALLLAKAGKTDEALRQIGRLKLEATNVNGLSDLHHAQYNIGAAYAVLGDARAAVSWLKKASHEGFPCYPMFASDRDLANVRQDGEFVAFLRELRTQWERFQATL